MDSFENKATDLINNLKKDPLGFYTEKERKQIEDLVVLAKTDRKEFVKRYMKLSGATKFDLPDIIYAELN